jgi:hypothetical protein
MRSMVEGFFDLSTRDGQEVGDPSTTAFGRGPPPHAAHREDLNDLREDAAPKILPARRAGRGTIRIANGGGVFHLSTRDGDEVGDPATTAFGRGPPPHAAHKEDLNDFREDAAPKILPARRAGRGTIRIANVGGVFHLSTRDGDEVGDPPPRPLAAVPFPMLRIGRI